MVNVLAMDYGDWAAPSPAGKTGRYADQSAQSAQSAAQHHIGRLAMWSLTRDKACAQPSAWADGTCSAVQRNAYDFAHTFEAFSD